MRQAMGPDGFYLFSGIVSRYCNLYLPPAVAVFGPFRDSQEASMNRVYRLVFNRVLGVRQVVSELARASCGGSSVSAVALGLLSPAAFAASYTVVDDASLRAALGAAIAGDSIVFASDITLSSNLAPITQSITIQGNGHVLSGNDAYRGFFVQQGAVSVGNLAITHATAQGGSGGGNGGGGMGAGGGLFVNSGAAVTLSNVQFDGNRAIGGSSGSGFNSGGGGGMAGNGGVAYPESGAGGGLGGGGGHGGTSAFPGSAGGGLAGTGGAAGSAGNLNGGDGAGAFSGGGGGMDTGFGGNGGDFSGGGGGGANCGYGGSGGFGGGGGGGGCGGSSARLGGSGGFGGGGGGNSGGAGFGGGNGGTVSGGVGGGGGGAGFGGAVFVRDGGSLTITGNSGFQNSSVAGGTGGPGMLGGAAGGNGSAAGDNLFLQGNGTLGIAPGGGEVTVLDTSTVADQSALGGTGVNAGRWGLVKTGAGVLQLNSSAGFSGSVQINQGTVATASDASLGRSSQLGLSGGTLQYLDGFTSTRSITLGAGGGTFDTQGFSSTLQGGVAGSGGLIKRGSGTLVLSGVNTYSGGTTIQGGTLSIASDGNLGAAPGVLAFDGGTLRNTSGVSSSRAVTLAAGGGTFETNADMVLSGTISGPGRLTKAGGNTLVVNGAAGHAGGTTISAGTLQIGNGGTTGSLAGDVVNNATLAFNRSDATSFAGAISGSGGLTKTGAGTLTLGASNTYGGGTTITAGTLAGTAASFGSGAIVNNAALAIDQASDATFANAISGSGGLTKTGAGTLTLGAINTYGGGTTVTAGTLAGTAASFGSGAVVNNAALAIDQASDATFANAISGSGGLTKTGAGALTLAPSNSYSGGTTITAGTLAGTAASFGNGAIVNNAALAINQASDAMLANAISGSGGLTKTGAGTLTLGARNTYGGGTTITAGTLAGTAASFGSGAIVNNAALAIDQASDSTFANAISGSGALTKTGARTLTLGAINSYSGGTRISAGTLVGSAASFGNGAIVNNAALAIDQASDATFANTLSGNGSLLKRGTAALRYTGDGSAFTGSTQVVAGTLSVNGTLGGTLMLASGTTLKGNGSVGTTTLQAGATVAPGNSIGTLTVNGDLHFSAGSSYQVEAEAGGGSDLIRVSGTATLGSASVIVLAADGNWNPVSRYTILTAGGGIVGTFGGVSSNFAFLAPALAYDAHSATLSLLRNDVSFKAVGVTPNQRAAGGGIEGLGSGALYRAVVQLDAPTARSAFDQLSGEVHASLRTSLIEDSRFVREAGVDRVRQAQGGMAAPADMKLDEGADGNAAWGRAFGSWGDTDGDANAARAERSTGGVLVGADRRVGDWRVGVMGGAGRGKVDVNDRRSSASIDSYHLGVYGGTQWGDIGLRTGASYSRHDIDTQRSIAVTGLADSTKASYHAQTTQAFGELGWRIERGAVALEPFANLAYVNLRTDGFGEQGGITALSGRSGKTDTVFTTLGLRASTRFDIGSTQATARGLLGWRHAFGDVSQSAALAVAGGSAFTVTGVPIAQDAAVIEAGLDFALQRNLTLGMSYSGQLGDGVKDHGVKASLLWKF
jgi:fibronectin-binding autotransporter adhesin